MSDSTEITVVEAECVQLGVIRVSGPADVVRRASSIASELANVIRQQRLSTKISGREFVRVEGWATLGAMLGVLPREVDVRRYNDGTYEAVVELVRVNDGAVIGRGSAICGIDETWGKRLEYARRSMAITRATGKAYRLGFSWIMTLAGYEPTPAEEMDGVEEHPITKPPIPRLTPKAPVQPQIEIERPAPPATVRGWLRSKAKWQRGEDADYTDASRRLPGDQDAPPDPKFVQRVAALVSRALTSGTIDEDARTLDNKRHSFNSYVFGVNSTGNFTDTELRSVAAWLEDTPGAWECNDVAAKECRRMFTEAMREAGQTEFEFAPTECTEANANSI